MANEQVHLNPYLRPHLTPVGYAPPWAYAPRWVGRSVPHLRWDDVQESFVGTTRRTLFFRALGKTCGGGSAVDPWSVIQKRYNTRNICGPRFWKTRPKKVPILRFNWRSKWLEGACYRKAVCVKVRVTNPRKPNSGMRKIARVQLPNKRIIRAYIPGIGHNLQAHSVVLVKGGRTHDVRGCNYKLVRGRYDLLPVKNRMRARSQYGVKKPKNNQHGPIVPTTTRFRRITTEEDMAKYEKITGKKMVLEKGEKDAHDKDTYLSPPWPLFSRAKPPFSYGKKKSRWWRRRTPIPILAVFFISFSHRFC